MPFTGGYTTMSPADYFKQQFSADQSAFQGGGQFNLGSEWIDQLNEGNLSQIKNPYYGLSDADLMQKITGGDFASWLAGRPHYGTEGGPSLVNGQVQIPIYQDPGDAEGLGVMAALTGAFGGLAAGAAGAGGVGAATSMPVDGLGSAAAGYGGTAGAGTGALGGGMWDYGDFLQSIGIDPASTQFAGGTLSNADIMASIGGGGGLNFPSLPPGTSTLLQQLFGGGGAQQQGAAQPGGQGAGLGALLPLLGIGSGLNTMFNPPAPAVDPARVNALWGAGQQTYNTALDPQQALYARTAQQTQDQVRQAEAARGITMSPYGAGVEGKAMGDFNIDWQNQQLQRQLAGLQGFTGAGGAAAQAGLANNVQAFLQNQTGLNNLTTGAGQLFGTTGGAPGAGTPNPIGSWLNSLFSGGGAQQPAGGGYSTFPTFDGGSSYNSQGTYQPFYSGYDSAGGPAYG